MKADLSGVKVGDIVVRILAYDVRKELIVSEVTSDRIVCGPWQFSRNNGAEIDEDLEWNEQNTGSYIEILPR